MLLLPLGVEAKTVDIPWATICFVVASCFYSILNMRGGEQVFEKQMALPERRAYYQELKAYLVSECGTYLKTETCKAFDEKVSAEQLLSEKLVVHLLPQLKKDKSEAKRLEIFVEPFLNEKKIGRLEISSTAYTKLKEKFQTYRASVSALYKEAKLFNQDNAGFVPLVRAQFLHGDYMHLIGNMLMLLLLAFPVEQRLGSVAFAGLYILSGFAGFWAESLGTTSYIVGASACIFGVAGAFLTLFFKQNMRVWVSFFFMTHQVVLMPVVIYFVVWVLSGELMGLSDGSNVARIAHLTGFATGAGLAFIYLKATALPEGLTYAYEKQYLEKSRAEKSPRKAVQILSHWLDLNPVSRIAAKSLFERFHEWRGHTTEQTSLNEEALKKFESDRLWPQIQRHIKDVDVLKEAPFDLMLAVPQSFNQKQLVKSLEDAHKKSDVLREWILLLPMIASSNEGSSDLEKRFIDLSSKLMNNSDFNDRLQELALVNPTFRKQLEDRGLWIGLTKADYAG